MTSDSIIKTTDYCGNLIYEQGRPKMLPVDGGYVTFNDSLSFGEGRGGVSYHYYLTDHLGNNRVVVGELRKDKKKMAKLYRKRSSRVNGQHSRMEKR